MKRQTLKELNMIIGKKIFSLACENITNFKHAIIFDSVGKLLDNAQFKTPRL